MAISHVPVLTHAQLKRWVEHPDFATALPGWVERLVRATAGENLRERKFLTEEEAQRQGYDGTSESTAGTCWFDAGEVVWEFGKTGNVRAKAKAEYARVAAHLDGQDGRRAKDTEFIFVTPRPFSEKRDRKDKKTGKALLRDRFDERTLQDWVAARRAECIYRNVRVVDAGSLIEWTNEHPDVALWVLHRLEGVDQHVGMTSPIYALEQNMYRFGDVGVDPDILTCGRAETVLDVQRHIAQADDQLINPGRMDLYANTAQEAVAFAAAIAEGHVWTGRSDGSPADGASQSEDAASGSLSIVLSSGRAVEHFRDRSNTVFILEGEAIDRSRELEGRNAVICCHAVSAETTISDQALRDPGQSRLSDYLRAKGVEEAYAVSAMAGGTLMSLRRLHGPHNPALLPPYATSEGVARDAVCVATLLGGWSAQPDILEGKPVVSRDQAVLEQALGEVFGSELTFRSLKRHLRDHTDIGREEGVADQLL